LTADSDVGVDDIESIVKGPALWAFVGFLVLVSAVLHGISRSPVMDVFERWERRRRGESTGR